jgi:hypothetical protein
MPYRRSVAASMGNGADSKGNFGENHVSGSVPSGPGEAAID